MENAKEFSEHLKRLLRARIPFITIRSSERNRVLRFIKEAAGEVDTQTYVHTLMKGLSDIQTERNVEADRSVAVAIDFAATQISQRANLTFVFTDIPNMDAEGDNAREVQDLVMHATNNMGSIILITTASVWSPLQRLGMAITLPLPTQDEMKELITQEVEFFSSQVPIEWDQKDIAKAAAILAGISELEMQNILATLAAKKAIRRSDLDELMLAKDNMFSDISGIERVSVRPEEISVGGLGGLQAWLNKKRALLTADLRGRGITPPRGVLLVGVPGCGKSLSAKAIAVNWNLPLYRLDMAALLGQYVGQSEGRLKDALSTADHVAPCVLWIDEIEKGLAGAGGSGDGGVSTRMVGQFLYWLQEARARVFVVATANDVSSLPQELLRKGRFDEIFFVDLPTPDERKDIIGLYVKRRLPEISLEQNFLAELVEISDGFAGADLEAAVKEVVNEVCCAEEEQAHNANNIQAIDVRTIATPDLFRSCFRNIVPFSKTSPERVDYIKGWGRQRAVPASGKPIASIPSGHSGRVVLLGSNTK